MSADRRVVVSVHSHHANRIYAGTKPFEFRRVGAGFASGDVVLIYETAPVSAVTGTARVAHVVRQVNTSDPAKANDPVSTSKTSEAAENGHLPLPGVAGGLAALEPDVHEREHVERYLDGASSPVALRLVDASRFSEPQPLSRVGLSRAPQSYQFLGA